MRYKSKYFSDDKKRKCGCGCGLDMKDEALIKFDKAREISDIPYVITSGARCKEYNAKIGGVADSAHTQGLAFDISFDNLLNLTKIIYGLSLAGFRRIGVNENKKFIHADIDDIKPNAIFKY